MKTCSHCGQDNDDAALRCACGRDLNERTAPPAAIASSTEAIQPAPSPAKPSRLVLRRILFLVWAISLVILYGWFRHRLKTSPFSSSLIVAGILCASSVGGLWFLGREKKGVLLGWRVFFALRAMFLVPLMLNIADGLAEYGWPSGRMNRPIAHILRLLIPLTVSTFLTGLCALIRLYRVAGVLGILSGVISIVVGGYLIPATKPFRHLTIVLGDILNNIMFAARIEAYIAMAMGTALIIGGIMMLRASRDRRTVEPEG